MRGKTKEKGQISIMVGMMTLTFILFFMFVVNIGMLVNAKINLQNAADLAAYAGAAVQARQLTQISFLNYEMRRQYKKFLFRYYVIGNMAQDSHPGTGPIGSSTGKRQWKGSQDAAGVDWGVPSVCVIFNARENFCHVAELPAITIPPATPLDAINSTLREQLKKIEDIRLRNCVGIGETNKAILGYWLMNTDPTLKEVETEMSNDPQAAGMLAVIKGLGFGLGIIPKEVLLRQRIETLHYYVNFPVQTGVTTGKAEELSGQGDVAARERTIQAFYSAYNTLGNHTFDDTDSIVMDELMPSSSEGAQMLILKDIKVAFDTYAMDFVVDGTPDNPQACKPYLVPIVMGGSVPVGVYKDPAILTYYALRLMANAKVMFNPFGADLKLKAYAAAQPFGSRIGPQLESSDFLAKGTANGTMGLCMPNGCVNAVPNLPVGQGDSAGSGGWNNNAIVYEMTQKFKSETSGSGGTDQKVDVESMERAYQAAMVPNPYEQGKYNIINDLVEDPFVKYFNDADHIYHFWAPLVSRDKMSGGGADELSDKVKQLVNALSKATPEGAGGRAKTPLVNTDAFREAFTKSMLKYVNNALKQGGGENSEGFDVVSLVDPFYSRPQAGAPAKRITLPDSIFMSDPNKVRSSFSGIRDGDLGKRGRTGYSVKFVSFKTLLKMNTTANGSAVWTNGPVGGTEGEADLEVIQH